MRFFAPAFAVIGALVSVVSAQTSSSATSVPSGIDQCVITCLSSAVSSGGCSSYTDLTCVCTSADYQNAAASCLESNCTQQEQQAALALQSQECGTMSASGSLSFTPSATSGSGSTSASATAPSGSGSSAASSGASGSSGSSSAAEMVEVNVGGLIGVGISLVGVVVGALAVL